MPEIFDIVQRINYEVQDGGLKDATNVLADQIKSIGVLSTRLDRLQKLLDSTASNDIQKRQRIISLINQQKQAIDNQNKAIDTQIRGNKQLQDALTKEIGLINLLDARYKQLQEDKKKAANVEEIKAINRELTQVENQLGRLNGAGKGGGIFSQLKSGLIQGLGLGAGFGVAGLVASGVSALGGFVAEAGRLAAETEGVQRAFDRLNQPNLLDNLRTATKGTVSDLELMKNAIQFSNFGLPVEKLATAMEFARVRAKETGVSVDYLVQSIVTGVGRQSPLILDNLGINAKRVAAEFQRTGNFADAAFKIIQEESAKAGVDLQTFSEKEAQVAAGIENIQAKYGQFFNQLKGYLLSIGEDFLTFFSTQSDGQELATQKYIKAIKEANQAKAEQVQVNVQANALFLQNFEDFTYRYTNADFAAREKIKNQAQTLYSTLSNSAKEYYKNDAAQLQNYLLGLQQAYARATQVFAKTPINLNTLSPEGVRGLSREQLTAVQDQITNSRGSLTSNDKAQITRLNQLAAAIKRELDIIDGNPVKKDTRLDKEIKKAQLLKEEIDKVKKSFDDIDEKDVSRFANEVANRAGMSFFTKNGKKNGTTDYYSSDEYQTSLLKFNIDAAKKQEQIDKDTADRAKAAKEKQQQQIRDLRDAYVDLGQTVLQSYNQILQAQQQMLDFQLQAQETRVDQATKLAERGNADQLRIEQDRLDQIQKKRSDNAKEQLEINALLQASNSAVALTEAIGAVVSAAAKGDPYTIAIRVAAAVAALVAGITALKSAFSGFKEGGYTGDGDPNDPAGVVHKKEFVMPAHITADPENRRILEAMYAGTYKPQEFATPISVNRASKKDLKGVEERLDAVVEALHHSGVNVKQSLDANGFSQAVETYKRKDQQRWS